MIYDMKKFFNAEFDYVNRAGKYWFTSAIMHHGAYKTGHKNLNYSLRIMLKNKKSYFKPDLKKGYDTRYIFIGGKKYLIK